MIIEVGNIKIGERNPFCLIAGPCVIENEKITLDIAHRLKEICTVLTIPLIFKTSYDKANRTSVRSFRGPGFEKGVSLLQKTKKELGLLITTDVHTPSEAEQAGGVLDVIQIPAFLCRQTDLLLTAGKTGKAVNVKKGQFLAPEDTRYIVEKIKSVGNNKILLTERGTFFGYHRLVVDFCSLPVMGQFAPVIFDATHSVQQPGGLGGATGGNREFVPGLSQAAVATGIAALFMEVHPDPDKALSDGPNSLALADLPKLLNRLKRLDEIAKED